MSFKQIARPPVMMATDIHLVASVDAISLIHGLHDHIMGVDDDGKLQAIKQLNYTGTLVIPPVIAKRLSALLLELMTGYEERWGKIADDPNWRSTTSGENIIIFPTRDAGAEPGGL